MTDAVADILLDWYDLRGRDLPWRRTRDPYRIWLSEVILQQTRVAQGLGYYLRFTERFPDVASLAAASEDEVLKLWQGLGYYNRARNLLAAAREVVARFGGEFPRTFDEVRSLRGVGDYTAAAICSAACDLPCAVVDGNVYRVLSRLYDLADPIDTTAGRPAEAVDEEKRAGIEEKSAGNREMIGANETVECVGILIDRAFHLKVAEDVVEMVWVITGKQGNRKGEQGKRIPRRKGEGSDWRRGRQIGRLEA